MPKVWTGPKFVMPERLYRYRPLACEKHWGHLEQILLDSTMYGAPPRDLRQMDPEDSRVELNTRCTLDQFKCSLYGREVARQHPEYSESQLRQCHENLMKPDFALDAVALLQGGVDKNGVICFSSDGDIPTQWHDYASESRGVCLAFDHRKDSKFFGKVKPVEYVDVLEPANVFTDPTDVQVRKRLYTKLAAQYESEAEFRALFPNGAGQQIPFNPEALVGVKPGSAMNDANRQRLEVILRRRSPRSSTTWRAGSRTG